MSICQWYLPSESYSLDLSSCSLKFLMYWVYQLTLYQMQLISGNVPDFLIDSRWNQNCYFLVDAQLTVRKIVSWFYLQHKHLKVSNCFQSFFFSIGKKKILILAQWLNFIFINLRKVWLATTASLTAYSIYSIFECWTCLLPNQYFLSQSTEAILLTTLK